MLNTFSDMIRGNLTKLQRLKIVALVTIEVHGRDVIEKLIKSGCSDVSAFEWLSQLRLYWDKVGDVHFRNIKEITIEYQSAYRKKVLGENVVVVLCLISFDSQVLCACFNEEMTCVVVVTVQDIDDCVARQTNTQFQYGYEYLGNSGRLVITPLTDR